MKIQLLNYRTALVILDGFRALRCSFSLNYYDKYGKITFNPREVHFVRIDVIDDDSGLISYLRVLYDDFLRLLPIL